MQLNYRPFQGLADLQAMIDLAEFLRSQGQRIGLVETELYEELDDPDVQASARLWEEQERLVGFAYIDRSQNIVFVFPESIFDLSVQSQMMDWLVKAAQMRNQVQGTIQTLDASAAENDLQRIEMLERFGFEKQEETSILYAFSLEAPLPEPKLPPGFSIRPVGGLAELEDYVDLHRAAFGTQNMTIEYRRSIMSTPGYLPELDLVAVAPDGSLAALCVCQIFEDNTLQTRGRKEGWTDPVATHPAYRRLGLSRALILTGMHLLKQHGMDTVLMGTSSTNLAMQAVAEAIGFKKESNTLWFCKNVG